MDKTIEALYSPHTERVVEERMDDDSSVAAAGRVETRNPILSFSIEFGVDRRRTLLFLTKYHTQHTQATVPRFLLNAHKAKKHRFTRGKLFLAAQSLKLRIC